MVLIWLMTLLNIFNIKLIMANYYDMSSQVIGILSVRIDKAAEWLGQGSLLTEQNLFPSPSIDQGYNTLLMHSDIFTHPFEIRKYFYKKYFMFPVNAI